MYLNRLLGDNFHLVLMLFFSQIIFSQVSIEGTVKLSESNEPVENAFLIISNQLTGGIIQMTHSDSKGNFTFKGFFDKGIYTIEVTRIGFAKIKLLIIIADANEDKLRLELKLDRSDFSQLREVEVTAQRPIIVKKDTTIYDVKLLKDVFDQSLEDVLSKIPGFKIHQNGDIEVNGKLIQKVLVDGKEISDFGAALLTKSIAAEDVDKVEVRFDEKNAKIRESLLDENKFVILDIQLKDKVNKSLFGKQNIQFGVREEFEIGGLISVFSLKKKRNVQFFAENNAFGDNFIKIEQLKNIGQEAVSKIFSLPQDYNDIKSRSGFSDELYGFRNYTQNDNSIAGLAINIPLSKSTDLYVGSFNNYHFLRNRASADLFFNDILLNSFREKNFEQDFNSKNKIQLKHTSENLKILGDVNFVAFDNNVVMNNEGLNKNLFNKKHFSNSFYTNLSLEYLINDKNGFSVKHSYTYVNYSINSFLNSNNPSLIDFLDSESPSDTLLFFQNQNAIERNTFTEAKFKHNTKIGVLYVGYKYLDYNFQIEKLSENNAFSNLETNPGYYQNSLFAEATTSLGNFSFDASVYLTTANFLSNKERNDDRFFEYQISANYNLKTNSSIDFSVSRFLSAFPFEKVISGNTLLDFQNIFIPRTNAFPFFTNTLSFTYFNNRLFGSFETSLAILKGNVKSNDQLQNFGNIVIRRANQLDTDFFLVSTNFTKRFKKLNLSLVPEFFKNNFDLFFNENSGKSKTERYLLGLKINQKLTNYLNADFHTKYSHFLFKNSFNPSDNTFNFFTNTLKLNIKLFKEELTSSLEYKNVYFLSNDDSFNNLDISLNYKKGKHKYFLIIGNFLNSNTFIIDDQEQNLFTSTQNSVFNRFVNVGFEIKF